MTISGHSHRVLIALSSAPTGEVGASPALANIRPNMAKSQESTTIGPNRTRAVGRRRDSGTTCGLLEFGPDGRTVERRPMLEGLCSTRTTSPF